MPLFLLYLMRGAGQPVSDPANLTVTVTDMGPALRQAHIILTLKQGWHVYSQVQPKGAISQPTRIIFSNNPLIKWIGGIKEAGICEKQRIEVLDIDQNVYRNRVDFIQRFSLKGAIKTNLSGTITYQACTDEMCLPPKTVSFSISTGGK